MSRLLTLVALFGIVNFASASFFSSKKTAFDKEGNCVPEVVAEHARLYSEIEALDKLATQCETQLKTKETEKQAIPGLKEISAKAKETLKAIKVYSKSYRDAACKAQVAKNGKKEVIIFNVNEKVASLEKLASDYQQFADKNLKASLASK